jgi:D-3-phosphoglycerate dehydrogenase
MVNAEVLETPVDNQTTQTTGANDIEETKRVRSGSFSLPKAKVLRPFNTSEVKILLLENINETAIKAFTKQGYQVNTSSDKIYLCIMQKSNLYLFILG